MDEKPGFWNFCKSIFDWLKQQGPALALLIYDWKDAEKKKAEQDAKQAQLELKLKENHDKVDGNNSNATDNVNKIAGPRD